MKKLVKLLSVVLALVLVFSTTSVAFAKTKSVTPVIVLHGLGGSDLYQKIGTEDEARIAQFGLDVQAMAKDNTMLSEVLKLFTDEQDPNYDVLFKHLGNYFKNTNINFKADGNPKDGDGILTYWTDSLANHTEYLTMRDFSIPVMARQIADIIGAENVYAFNYDWRVDLCDTADKLNEMVQAVKKSTGAQKVTIVALSLGGAVVSAYMDKYKSKKDVGRYVLVNPAYQGADATRAFMLDLQFDKKKVIPYLKHMEQAYQAGEQENLFKAITALGDVRISNALDNLNEDIIGNPKMRKKFFLEVVKPWIGNIPTFYELLPYDDFDKAVSTLVKMGYLDKSSGLYKKIQRYHKVQGRLEHNLKVVKRSGAEVAIIANYGTMGLPVTSKYKNHSDLLIDTKYASVGATVAKYGKTLTGKNAKGKYVSGDKIINASTCALKNNTWFYKGIIHGLYKYNGGANIFIANLATGQVKCNLKAVKKKYGYTQFMVADNPQNLTNL